MSEFFRSQMDYVFFIYGLSLILLAFISWALHKKDPAGRPWVILGFFALVHGINEWVDMFSLNVASGLSLRIVRLILLSASFFILMEFGRRGLKRVGKFILGRWVPVFLCALASLGALAGDLDSLEVTCRYAFAFPGGILAGLVFWCRWTDDKKEQNILLKAAGGAILIYGFAAGLIVPKTSIFPSVFLNYESFFSACGFPVQLLRTVCIIFCTFFLFNNYFYSYFVRGLRMYIQQGLSMFYWLALMLTIVIFSGWAATNQIGQEESLGKRKELLAIAKAIASSLDTGQLRALKRNPADQSSSAFEQLRQRQMEAAGQLKENNVRWIYLMILQEGKIVFTADSISKDDPSYSPPGDVYTDAPDELWETFQNGTSGVSAPYRDRWGSFVSAFVPIVDTQTREVLGVLGVDINTKEWETFLFRHRRIGIVFMFFLVAMIIVFLFFQYRILDIQHELAESREQLRLALSSSQMGTWSWDILEKRYYWDEQTHILNGTDAKTFFGQEEHFLKIVYPEDRNKVKEALVQAIAKGIYAIEYRIIWPNGSVHDISASGKVLYNSKEQPIRLSGICFDITERKKKESQMRALSRAVEQSPSAIMITDRMGIIEYVNPRFEQATGYANAEIIGKNPRFLKSDKTPAETYRALWKAISEGGEWRGEICNRRKNGELFWEYSAMSGLIDEAGRISHYIAVKEDITARKKAEEALQESERLLRNIIDTIPGGVFWKDKNSVYLGCNAFFAKTSGISSSQDIVGKTDFDLAWTNEEANNYRQHDKQVIESRQAKLNIEITQHQADGSLRYLIVNKVPWRTHRDEIIGVLGISVDITKIKQMEFELVLARDAAQQASEVKGQFLDNMSHEIRTPMNSILGFSRLLKRFSLEEKAQHYLDIILINGDHLLGIVNDILDMSRIDSGGIALEAIEFDLKKLISDVFSLVKYKLHEKSSIELGYHIADNVVDRLVGDPMRLKQVVLNLLGNAIKFTAQGSIFLNVTLEKDKKQTDDDVGLRFSLQDTGIGIPTEKIETIFEKFTQVDSSTTRKYGGTGLGLAICRQLVTLMGGKIWASSKLGVGSEFVFTVKLKMALKQ